MKCPVTNLETDTVLGELDAVQYVHRPDGNWHDIMISQYVLERWRKTSSTSIDISDAEFNQAIDLFRSMHWRALRDGGRPLFLTWQKAKATYESEPARYPKLQAWNIVAIEDLAGQASQLTFSTKCLNTLENIYDEWRKSGSVPDIPWAALDDKQHTYFFERPGEREDGMAYGCDGRTAYMVYQWIFDQGFLVDRIISQVWKQLELTPSAFIEVEKIKAGRESSLKRGFFIRRYDPETDEFYRPILAEVQRETGCEISAVWERQKNEKLDELILRRIRESSVIVLDVTGERFNVGLEAGFALALRKQIILLRDKADPFLPIRPDSDEKHLDVPFDIRTLNCFFYDRGEPEKLTAMLKERVLDALEEARLGTH